MFQVLPMSLSLYDKSDKLSSPELFIFFKFLAKNWTFLNFVYGFASCLLESDSSSCHGSVL